MIVRENNIPNVSQDIELLVTWMNQSPLSRRKKVIIKHTTNECIGLVVELKYKIDINTLHRIENIESIQMNDIARISIRNQSLYFLTATKKIEGQEV